ALRVVHDLFRSYTDPVMHRETSIVEPGVPAPFPGAGHTSVQNFSDTPGKPTAAAASARAGSTRHAHRSAGSLPPSSPERRPSPPVPAGETRGAPPPTAPPGSAHPP